MRRTPSGFDSRNPAYAPRVRGVMGEFPGEFRGLLGDIDNGFFGGYEDGVDEGIMRLGRVVDGNIHNWGHMALAAHTPPGARGLAQFCDRRRCRAKTYSTPPSLVSRVY